MAIKFYVKKSRLGRSSEQLKKPKVSIARSGSITFNAKATREFGLTDFSYVLLGYDEESRLIAIKPLKAIEDGARKLTKCGIQFGISAVGFLHHIGIAHEVCRSYPLSKNEDGLLVFSLNG